MKFYCDSCNAKYLIGDEKVQGKALRIRCKRCGHVMTVRGPSQVPLGGGGEGEPLELESGDGGVEWYYSRSGENFGPLALSALQEMFQTGQLGDEAYVWNATFTGWVPARERAEFQTFFAQGLARRSPRPTMNLHADDIKAAMEEAQSRQSAPANGLSASPAASTASPAAASTSRPYGGVDRSGTRSRAITPLARPSSILKRATAAHDQASGASILSRPGEAAVVAEAEASQPTPEPSAVAAPVAAAPQPSAGADPGDRLRALREKLSTRNTTGLSAIRREDAMSASSSATPPLTLSSAAAPAAASPSASAPSAELPRPSGLRSPLGVGTRVPTGVVSLRERLAQRTTETPAEAPPLPSPLARPAPLLRDEPEPEEQAPAETPLATEVVRPTTPPAHEPAPLDEIPELSLDEMDEDVDATAMAFSPAEDAAPALSAPIASAFGEPRPPVPTAVEEDLDEEEPPLSALASTPPASFRPTPTPKVPEIFDEDDSALFARPGASAPMSADVLMPLPSGSTAATLDDGEMSRSLVLQLDELRRRNRRLRMVMGIGAAAALFALTIGVVVYVVYFAGPSQSTQALADEARLARERQAQRNNVGRADFSKQRGYGVDQLAELKNVIELGEDDGEEPVEQPAEPGAEAPPVDEQGAGGAVEAPGSAEATPPRSAPGESKPRVASTGLKVATDQLTGKGTSLDQALASSQAAEDDKGGIKRGTGAEVSSGQVARVDPTGGSELKDVGAGGDSVFRDLASQRPKTEIERADRAKEGNDAAPGLPDTLDKKALVAGFKNVRQSADQCVERHLKRSGALPKGKVKVVVKIETDGSVSDVKMDPEVANTVFESCMRSHTGRWRFPKFGGDALHVARVFLLQ